GFADFHQDLFGVHGDFLGCVRLGLDLAGDSRVDLAFTVERTLGTGSSALNRRADVCAADVRRRACQSISYTRVAVRALSPGEGRQRSHRLSRRWRFCVWSTKR